MSPRQRQRPRLVWRAIIIATATCCTPNLAIAADFDARHWAGAVTSAFLFCVSCSA